MSLVTLDTPASSRSDASGAVASSAPATNSSFWIRRMSVASSSSAPVAAARQSPRAEAASSTAP